MLKFERYFGLSSLILKRTKVSQMIFNKRIRYRISCQFHKIKIQDEENKCFSLFKGGWLLSILYINLRLTLRRFLCFATANIIAFLCMFESQYTGLNLLLSTTISTGISILISAVTASLSDPLSNSSWRYAATSLLMMAANTSPRRTASITCSYVLYPNREYIYLCK